MAAAPAGCAPTGRGSAPDGGRRASCRACAHSPAPPPPTMLCASRAAVPSLKRRGMSACPTSGSQPQRHSKGQQAWPLSHCLHRAGRCSPQAEDSQHKIFASGACGSADATWHRSGRSLPSKADLNTPLGRSDGSRRRLVPGFCGWRTGRSLKMSRVSIVPSCRASSSIPRVMSALPSLSWKYRLRPKFLPSAPSRLRVPCRPPHRRPRPGRRGGRRAPSSRACRSYLAGATSETKQSSRRCSPQ